MNKSFMKELRGKDAREQLLLMQQEVQNDFQLFSFSNPGLVSFTIRGNPIQQQATDWTQGQFWALHPLRRS